MIIYSKSQIRIKEGIAIILPLLMRCMKKQKIKIFTINNSQISLLFIKKTRHMISIIRLILAAIQMYSPHREESIPWTCTTSRAILKHIWICKIVTQWARYNYHISSTINYNFSTLLTEIWTQHQDNISDSQIQSITCTCNNVLHTRTLPQWTVLTTLKILQSIKW